MEWSDWIGKKVFIKLIDGSVFSESLVNDFSDGFLSLTDQFNNSVTVNVLQIVKIVDDVPRELKGGKRK